MARIDKKCEDCRYSQPSLNDELVYCSYIGDTIGIGDDMRKAEHVVDTINFSGVVYSAFVEMFEGADPEERPCVQKGSKCRKFSPKRD